MSAGDRVQVTSALSGGVTITPTLAAPPTAGNLLIALVAVRAGASVGPMAGFTALGQIGTPGGTFSNVFYRQAEAGDPAAWPCDVGGAAIAWLGEYEGPLALDATDTASGSNAAGSIVAGSVTPAAGKRGVVIGLYEIVDGEPAPAGWWTADATWTLAGVDGSGPNPQIVVVDQAIALTAGTYEPRATRTIGIFDYASRAVVFVAAPPSSARFVPRFW